MFNVNNKEATTTSTVSLFLTLLLTLRILVSLLLTLNIFHILHDVKNAEIRALYWKKRKKSKFNRLQIEVFFLPNISPPYISPLNIGPSNLSFVRIYAQGVLKGFYGNSYVMCQCFHVSLSSWKFLHFFFPLQFTKTHRFSLI